jgi:hypothetical protein
MAHAVGDLVGAEAAGGGDDVDRFEETGLAGAVAAEEEVRAPPRPPVEGLQIAEVVDQELGDQEIRSAWA